MQRAAAYGLVFDIQIDSKFYVTAIYQYSKLRGKQKH